MASIKIIIPEGTVYTKAGQLHRVNRDRVVTPQKLDRPAPGISSVTWSAHRRAKAEVNLGEDIKFVIPAGTVVTRHGQEYVLETDRVVTAQSILRDRDMGTTTVVYHAHRKTPTQVVFKDGVSVSLA